MRVFIVAGSPTGLPPAGLAPGPGDRVIAADYGAHYARAWGWPVHLLVGDLDSLPADEAATLRAEGVPAITAPQAKDETDLELALDYALGADAVEIVICAALGGRVDHLLANVLLLTRPELAGVKATIADGPVTIHLLRGGDAAPETFTEPPTRDASLVDRRGEGRVTNPFSMTETVSREEGASGTAHLELDGAAGDLLSLLPIGGDAVGVTTRGLVYPLHDETLHMGQARGVSNVFESATAHVWLRSGLLLVIHTQTG